MCKTMKDFENLVTEILNLDAEIKQKEKELDTKKDELKAYMKKRQKETLPSVKNELVVSYTQESQRRFDKDLFLASHSEAQYSKYCTETSFYKLKFLKEKKKSATKKSA